MIFRKVSKLSDNSLVCDNSVLTSLKSNYLGIMFNNKYCIMKNRFKKDLETIEMSMMLRNYLNVCFNDVVEITELRDSDINTLSDKTIDVLVIKPNIVYEDDLLIICGFLSNININNKNGYTFIMQTDTPGFITSTTKFNFIEGKGVKIIKKVKLDFSPFNLGIGGLDIQITELFKKAFISRTLSEKIYSELGIKHEKGVLLYGPPGCGKTLIAKKISEHIGVTDIKMITATEIFSKWIGESEEKLRNLFTTSGPESDNFRIVIIDEIDAITGNRSGGEATKVYSNIVNQLLGLMDGTSENNVLVIGMTNRIDIMDPALLRSGRFGTKIYIPLPNQEGRREIFNIHLKKAFENKRCSLTDKQINILVDKTNGFSGADISGLIHNAQCSAAHNNKENPIINIDDFEIEESSTDNFDVSTLTSINNFTVTFDNISSNKIIYFNKIEDAINVSKLLHKKMIIIGEHPDDGNLIISKSINCKDIIIIIKYIDLLIDYLPPSYYTYKKLSDIQKIIKLYDNQFYITFSKEPIKFIKDILD